MIVTPGIAGCDPVWKSESGQAGPLSRSDEVCSHQEWPLGARVENLMHLSHTTTELSHQRLEVMGVPHILARLPFLVVRGLLEGQVP